MKKVVLLGDSIRLMGYGEVINKYLPEFEIWQPEDNCRFSQYLLRMLFDYKDQIEGADVIHFNAGLWDTCYLFEDGQNFTPIEEYKRNLSRIADILLSQCDKVIFALTTPVNGEAHNTNETIQKYNEAAMKVLKPKGIIINDLYSLVMSDLNANIRDDDKIHLSDAGKEKTAKQVADLIKSII